MFGSGHHGNHPDRRPLGEALKEEVLSTLRLLFKSVGHHPVELALPMSFTAYETSIACETTRVSLEAPPPEVSLDPVQALRRQASTATLSLISEARLAEDTPCQLEPVLCHEPVLDEMTLDSTLITFENVTQVRQESWPVEVTAASAQGITPESFPAPRTGQLQDTVFRTSAKNLSDTLPRVRTQNNPRFYALPIKKVPIPPHRFPAEVREQFRKALAEKGKTNPANIQLKIVFERMDMSIFSTLQQDEQGNLLCTPKNELLGRNRETQSAQNLLRHQAVGGAYLVFGFRLDTKEDLRALVPASTLKRETAS